MRCMSGTIVPIYQRVVVQLGPERLLHPPDLSHVKDIVLAFAEVAADASPRG